MQVVLPLPTKMCVASGALLSAHSRNDSRWMEDAVADDDGWGKTVEGKRAINWTDSGEQEGRKDEGPFLPSFFRLVVSDEYHAPRGAAGDSRRGQLLGSGRRLLRRATRMRGGGPRTAVEAEEEGNVIFTNNRVVRHAAGQALQAGEQAVAAEPLQCRNGQRGF